MRTFDTLAELAACQGEEVAVSDWLTVTQDQINVFAVATGDHQWIHVDPDKARSGPFGTTVAHGYLTLSLLPAFYESALHVTRMRMGVNYGLNKVRFIAPVPVDSELRARFHLLAAATLEHGVVQLTWKVSVEREGSARPVCVAESVIRCYP